MNRVEYILVRQDGELSVLPGSYNELSDLIKIGSKLGSSEVIDIIFLRPGELFSASRESFYNDVNTTYGDK